MPKAGHAAAALPCAGSVAPARGSPLRSAEPRFTCCSDIIYIAAARAALRLGGRSLPLISAVRIAPLNVP